MTPDAFTVVNQYAGLDSLDAPVHMKFQCMHCLHPACVSACLVKALTKASDGTVVYDAGKCIGCRYCMVACPFQVPSYEYERALTPRVRKCDLCYDRRESARAASSEGEAVSTLKSNDLIPACAQMCPPQALTFGPREALLELAQAKIEARPEAYVNHIYGEHEVGGTAWLYLAPKSFEELGLPALGNLAPPAQTEKLQHAVFQYGIPPVLLFGFLGALMRTLKAPVEETS